MHSQAQIEKALAGEGWAAAREHCLCQLRKRPDDADAHRRLALLLSHRGESLAALRSAVRACELSPRDARCWSDLGRVHAASGRYLQALGSFENAVRADEHHADAWHNLGLCLRKLGRHEQAFPALKQALLLDDTRAETWLLLGNLLAEARQFDDAVECFERAARNDPSLARARSRLGHELATRGRVGRAEHLFRESLGMDPDHLPGWLGLARVLEDMGEAEGAQACLRNVLAREPRHPLAMGQLLALVRDDSAAPLAARAGSMLDELDGESRALIGYGLAKYHDRRGDFANAARAGLAANAARRKSAGPLDRAALTARVEEITTTCTREFFAARRRYGLTTEQPVFIVGLPRSGTTLTEQILSQHPGVHGAGELPDLARIAADAAGEGEAPWRAVHAIDEHRSRECGQQYLAALRSDAPRGRAFIIDKSPLNFFHLGFIALLFPNARVIHCHRGARDNALSMWLENFNAGQTYATDFAELAFHHAQYRRLMAHWKAHLPLRLFECEYERTVHDIEGQARRLVGFLDLPWTDGCLHFHASERAVQTPSRWQVRKPIYRSSVERWRNYAAHLPELSHCFPQDDQQTEKS
jgi:tetratricopeptide (TPR) repeat protein